MEWERRDGEQAPQLRKRQNESYQRGRRTQILPRSPSGIGPPQAYHKQSIVIDPCQFPTFSRTCTARLGQIGDLW